MLQDSILGLTDSSGSAMIAYVDLKYSHRKQLSFKYVKYYIMPGYLRGSCESGGMRSPKRTEPRISTHANWPDDNEFKMHLWQRLEELAQP